MRFVRGRREGSHRQASSVRPDFSATAGLRQLGQPHQKFPDKFLDLFDPVVRGARLNVSTREIGTTGKIRASSEISCLRICRRRTARRIRRFPDVGAGARQPAPRAAHGQAGRPPFPSGLPAPALPKSPATPSEASPPFSVSVPRLPRASRGRAQARTPLAELGSYPRPSSQTLPVQDLPTNPPPTVRAGATQPAIAVRRQQDSRLHLDTDCLPE